MLNNLTLTNTFRECKPDENLPIWPDLSGVVSSNDTVSIISRNYERRFEAQLKAARLPGMKAKKAVKVRRIRFEGRIVWHVYRITKPTARTYEVLRRWHAFGVCRVDIATDFRFNTCRAAEEFKRWAAMHCRLRWAPNNGFWYEDTRYFVDFRGGKQTRRSMILYTNRDDNHVIRLEIKFHGTPSVKANDLQELVHTYETTSPRDVIAKHVMVKQLNPHFIGRQVKRELARDFVRGCKSWPRWRQHLAGKVSHVIEQCAHDLPNHKLPMKVVSGSVLLGLIPMKLTIPS